MTSIRTGTIKKHSTNILEVRFKSFEDFKREIRKSLLTRKSSIQPTSEVVFESPEAFRKFMTIQKIEILSMIASHNFPSIYELAKSLDRDFAAVLRDCTVLEGSGFLRLVESESVRKAKIPKLAFPYSCIRIHAPKHPRLAP